jgi:hypothetical protein
MAVLGTSRRKKRKKQEKKRTGVLTSLFSSCEGKETSGVWTWFFWRLLGSPRVRSFDLEIYCDQHQNDHSFSRLLCKLVTSRFVQNAPQSMGFKM